MPNESEVRAALEQGLKFLAHRKSMRGKVREQSREVYARGDLMEAHWLCMGVIASATSAVSGRPGKIDPDLAHVLSLTASFIQGIDLCEVSITEGLYVSATELLKQEMETIAAIQEFRGKSRKSGKTRNVNAFGELALIYGDLNGIADVSNSEMMQKLMRIDVSEQHSGAPLYPVLNEKVALMLYGLHVAFVAMIAVEVAVLLIAFMARAAVSRFGTGTCW